MSSDQHARNQQGRSQQDQSRQRAQGDYEQMMRLAHLFDRVGGELRERAALGQEVLADEDVADSEALSPTTYAEAEARVVDATTGRHGLLAHSVELDADALAMRATVLTYRWLEDLQHLAERTLGSIAARAVGYLAPEVALGGAIFSAGLIETDALDRDGLASYLNELAEANPDLMDHVASGGGGLIDRLRMRSLLTVAALGRPEGAAAARGGLRAVGAPAFEVDAAAGLRDVAAGLVEDAEPDLTSTVDGGTAPRSLEDLMNSLSTVGGDLLVQQAAPGRFIAFLPHRGSGTSTLRLVGGDHAPRVASVVAALESATEGVDDARVMLVGHAQGGVTAAELAAQASSERFTIDQVVTAGAPSAHVPRIPEGTSVLALEDRADPVALLGSLVNAGVPNRLTVVFDGGEASGPSAYVAGGRAADRAAHPELLAAIRRIQELGYLSAS